MNKLEIFPERLRKLRKEYNETQKEFAANIGITAATLSAYETGTKTPPLNVAVVISKKYDVSIDWLCGRTDTRSFNSFSNLGEVISCLVEICKYVPSEVHKIGNGIPWESEVSFEGSVSFFNETIADFLGKWREVKKLFDNKTIDKDLYDAWVETKIREYKKYPLLLDSEEGASE